MDTRNIKTQIDEDFLATHFFYGLLVRGSLDDVTDFKQLIHNSQLQTGVEVVYQKLDPRPLRIVIKEDGVDE